VQGVAVLVCFKPLPLNLATNLLLTIPFLTRLSLGEMFAPIAVGEAISEPFKVLKGYSASVKGVLLNLDLYKVE
jgi:hypothetical protein